MIETVLFIAIILAITIGIINPIISSYASIQSFSASKQAFLASDSGIEEALYRLKNSKQVPGSISLSVGSASSTINVTSIASGKRIYSVGQNARYFRNEQLDVAFGTGIAFHYGIQSGQGGFVLQNSSSITGNVFSSGTVTGAGNMINGDVISAGSSGLINGIHATGTAFAHTIQNSTVDKDAYYMVKTSTTVGGTSYPNSPDQGPVALPISDAQISQWESDALSGGVMLSSECDSYSSSTNTCTISTSKSIGPKKIPFNLFIKSSSGVLTVKGALWVVGNITTQTGPTIRMDPALGAQNVAVIADDPSDNITNGIITVGQSTIFAGSGTPGSFVFMISQNKSSETGGSTDAISMNQGASALVTYASHGQITLSQSVSIKEATAYKIILTQSANVTYDTGLPNTLFSAGPGGGYDPIEWDEI
jgi:hypothetical protein